MTARCWFPQKDGYVQAEELTPQQREQVSRQLTQRIGAALQEWVQLHPEDYGKV